MRFYSAFISWLEPVSGNALFETFESKTLTFLSQDTLKSGEESRLFRFVSQ